MRKQLRDAVSVCVAGVVLSACSDRPTSAPTAPLPPRANLSSALPPTCDPATLTSLANLYAASSGDPLFAIITGLQSVGYHGASPLTTDLVFDGLSRLAAMRGTSAQKSGATGTTFDGADEGLARVRRELYRVDGPDDVLGGGRVRCWLDVRGARRQHAGWRDDWRLRARFDAVLGGRAAVGSDVGELAARDGAGNGNESRVDLWLPLPNFSTLDPKVASAFEIATIPTVGSGVLTLTPSLHIGLCDVSATVTARVEHVVTILPNAALACATPPAFAAASRLRGAGAGEPALAGEQGDRLLRSADARGGIRWRVRRWRSERAESERGDRHADGDDGLRSRRPGWEQELAASGRRRRVGEGERLDA